MEWLALLFIVAVIVFYWRKNRNAPKHVKQLLDRKYSKNYTPEDRANMQRIAQEKKVDAILDKIHKHGMESLTPAEKQILQDYGR